MQSFKEAYQARFKGTITRVHAVFAATVFTPVFLSRDVGVVQGAVIWLHFYHCVGFMVAAWNYWCVWFEIRR